MAPVALGVVFAIALAWPQGRNAAEIVIPNGGETFHKSLQDNEDTFRTGADWGVSQPGRLKPGIGGGSGRLGDLIVGPGQIVTLRTGPVPAEGYISFKRNPDDGDSVRLNNTFINFFNGGFGVIESDPPFTPLTLSYFVQWANVTQAGNVNLNAATYYLETFSMDRALIRIVHDTPGSSGNAYTLQYTPANPVDPAGMLSGPTLAGGASFENFVAGNLLDNFDFQSNPGGTPPDIAVSDGVFEFATIRIDPNGVVRCIGPNPARIFARGEATIQGLIDVSGTSPGEHPSGSPLGQPITLARGGPNAGDGGEGGNRPNNAGGGAQSLVPPNRAMGPGPTTIPLSEGIVTLDLFPFGKPGEGVSGVTSLGAGLGGARWPAFMPLSKIHFELLETNANCVSEQVGGAGSGGAYSLDGGLGVAQALSPTSQQGHSNTPPVTPGGDASVLGIEPPGASPFVRTLSPLLGFLRGGSGGGGGGVHPKDTATSGTSGACLVPPASIVTSVAVPYRSHSGAAGGGGGGALQLQAGRLARLLGVLDAHGGDGGDALVTGNVNDTQASPGGGGSGGGVLVHAQALELAQMPGRIGVAGGDGGDGVSGSRGGDGSPGLVRIEANRKGATTQLAAAIDPFDPQNPLSVEFLSVGTWERQRGFPEVFSGAQSCWMRPTGTFTSLHFVEDEPSRPGWDMQVELDIAAGPTLLPYRKANGVTLGTLEETWGQLLDRGLAPGEVGAPIVVRFQGARLAGTLPQPPEPCGDVPLTGPSSPILPGSLTPWVRHPAELNAFTPAPDMIRFVVIFDAEKTAAPRILGVTNLRIRAVPQP